MKAREETKAEERSVHRWKAQCKSACKRASVCGSERVQALERQKLCASALARCVLLDSSKGRGKVTRAENKTE